MPNIVNTELSVGLVETPAFKNSSVGDVADAVIHALQYNRYDVFVPRSIGPTWATMNLVPRRGRDFVARALKLDRALVEADHTARAAYEARAAASAPGRRRRAPATRPASSRAARAAAAGPRCRRRR